MMLYILKMLGVGSGIMKEIDNKIPNVPIKADINSILIRDGLLHDIKNNFF